MIGVGVDIGGTFVKFFVLNEKGEILRTEKIETDYARGAKGFIDQVATYINRFKQEYAPEPLAVAVGAPGDVDNQKGILRYNPNLKFTDVDDWPIAQQLQEKTGILPRVVNDATLAAWGVYETDLHRQGTNVLVVTLGTGVGGGLILNRELYQGSNGTAGEIGHMKIEDTATGPLCGCGSHGCLEAFVGTIGIKRRVHQAVEKHPQSELARLVGTSDDFKIEPVFRAAQNGCPVARQIWEDTGRYLGVGIANLVLVLDIDTVVLTGGVSGAAPYFMPALKHVLDAQPFKTPFRALKLLVSKNPNIGGVGAALYAIHHAKNFR
ncbi:ROK family protein [Candidatus Avelusimicrobium luingense]|uniref:ROK family protein n=1 Tax=Candidatus Avelusimicrobium luingense TaxID=3416211 RepID=UPI003D0A6488